MSQTLEEVLEIAPGTYTPARGDNVASKRGQRKRADDIKQAQLDRLAFVRRLLADPEGRRWLWQLFFSRLHAFNTDFNAAPVGLADNNAAWYERGKQDAGLALYHDLCAIDRAGILLMHDEYDPRFPKADA